LIQLEIRRVKFTSEEAVRRSRLAVQRRVAAKLERQAQKAKEDASSEAERKEKLEHVSDHVLGEATQFSFFRCCYVIIILSFKKILLFLDRAASSGAIKSRLGKEEEEGSGASA
jgi:hypothetical protein